MVDPAGEIFGDVPNITARAQALAELGAVVITARVQRQVAELFVAAERGSHEFKGVPQPVKLFRIIRASGGGRRAGQCHLASDVRKSCLSSNNCHKPIVFVAGGFAEEEDPGLGLNMSPAACAYRSAAAKPHRQSVQSGEAVSF